MHFEPVTAAYSRPQLFKKLSGKKYFNEEYSRNKGQNIDSRKNADRISCPADKSTKIIKKDPYTNVNLYLKEIFQTDQY